MPELTEESTSPPVAVPPAVDPESWEAFPVFRESFLMYVTPLPYSGALRLVGQMLYDLVLEPPEEWPGWGESTTRREMRAAAADLRHVQGFLGGIGKERQVASLSPGDVKLSRYASSAARMLNRIANTIENRLAKEEAAA
jgi:hypothetical protein